jgi:hypothetical protein
VTFDWHDIVRSDFLRDYIMTKEMLGMRWPEYLSMNI